MASYITPTHISFLNDIYFQDGVSCWLITCDGCGAESNDGYYKCLDCYDKDACEICILGSGNSGITKCLKSHRFSEKQVYVEKTIGENQFRILKEYKDDSSSQDVIAIDQDNKLYLSTSDNHGRIGVYSVPDNYTFEQLKTLIEEKEIDDTSSGWDAFYNTRVKRTMSDFGMQIHYG